MKKHLLKLFLLALVISNISLKADEGMFLPMFINKIKDGRMKKAGLKLTAQDIYSVNSSSLKDAIVNFSGFCTGEIISKNGLILTNHHCGYGAIASLSTPQDDILKNGFWAKSYKEERQAKGIFIAFLDKMEDVSDEVNRELEKVTSEKDRASKTKEIIKKIQDRELEKNKNVAGIDIVVKSFFKENEFYIFYYKKYTDIRLVGTPPSSIGKYGSDTDNWMWPRHTGDFSIFRVYSDKNGNPANYSEENIPLKVKNHLKISLSGISENDYAMIMGYPGRTERYLPSFGVKKLVEDDYPIVVRNLGEKIGVMKKYMQKDPAIFINYASMVAQQANTWKNRDGMIFSLNKLNVIKEKEILEQKFIFWVNSDKKRKEVYGNSLKLLEEGYSYDIEKSKDLTNISNSINGDFMSNYIFGIKKNIDTNKIDILQNISDNYWKKRNYEVEKEVFIVGISRILKEVKNLPSELLDVKKEDLEKIYDESMFSNKEKFNSFISSFDANKIKEDKLYKIYNSCYELIKKSGLEYQKEVGSKLDEGYRLFVKGLREMEKNKYFTPDANFTMRLTYGNILPYSPKDGVKYNYYTTMEGVMEKYKKDDFEFDLPKKLIELYENKDYGRYKDKKGFMPVCFLTNNDITGGNSGSPVMNAKGHLIGTAFDGNWDALSGDIKFNTDMQRTIICDIRYVLFIVEKLGGAKNIIDELEIVK